MNEEVNPFDELKTLIRSIIKWTVVFGVVISLMALSGLSISSIVLYAHLQDQKQNIRRNEETITALCRELNERDRSLKITAIDLGAPPSRLVFLKARPCNAKELRQEYGIK